MELNIYHLYPEHLNLYGDLGNVNCLKRRCLERGIEVNVVNFTDDEKPDLSSLSAEAQTGPSNWSTRISSSTRTCLRN